MAVLRYLRDIFKIGVNMMIGYRQVGLVILRALWEKGKWDPVRVDPNSFYRGEDAMAVMREAFKSVLGLPPLATSILPIAVRMFAIDSQIPCG